MDEETNNNDHLEENVSQESDVNTESTKNEVDTGIPNRVRITNANGARR